MQLRTLGREGITPRVAARALNACAAIGRRLVSRPLAVVVIGAIAAMFALLNVPQDSRAWTPLPTGTVWRDGNLGGHVLVAWDPFAVNAGVHTNTGRVRATPLNFFVGYGGARAQNVACPAGNMGGGGGAGADTGEVTAAVGLWNAAAGGADISFAVGANAQTDTEARFSANGAAGVGAFGVTNNNRNTITLASETCSRPTDHCMLRVGGVAAPRAGSPLTNADAFTTLVHEVGHVIGLDHRHSVLTVMTPHSLAIGNVAAGPGGIPAAFTPGFTDPAAGQWAADPAPAGLAAGTVAWCRERDALAQDDIRGMRTLYSEPAVRIDAAAGFPLMIAANRWRYAYQLTNTSLNGSDYHIGTVVIAHNSGIAATTLVNPGGWSVIENTANRIIWQANRPGLPPGGQKGVFGFDHPNNPAPGVPQGGFLLPTFSRRPNGADPNGDLEPEPGFGPEQPLTFDPMDDAANLVDSSETEIPGSSSIAVGGLSLDPATGGASGPDAWLLAEVIAASAATAVALGAGALYLRRRRLR